MSSVTKRISEIKQPRGGYIKPSQFEIHKIEDGHILSETECARKGGINPTLSK